MAFRLDEQVTLIAFAGSESAQIIIDGRPFVFAENSDVDVAWAPVDAPRRVPGGAFLQIRVRGEGVIRIPSSTMPPRIRLVAEGNGPGSLGTEVPCAQTEGTLTFTATAGLSGRWLYAVPA